MNKDLYRITDLIYREFLGELSEKEREELDRWIDSDIRHKQYHEQLFTNYSLDRIKSLDVVDTVAAWEKWSGRNRTKRLVWEYVRYAAVIVLLISVASWLYFGKEQNGNVPVIVANGEMSKRGAAILTIEGKERIVLEKSAFGRLQDDAGINVVDSSTLFYGAGMKGGQTVMHVLEVPRRGEFFILLSDSTRVWINAESRLRYPSVFKGDERVVELEGEAYFEVHEDRERPFVVRTGGIEVEVLGTRFNVVSYKDVPDVVTTLVAGKVRVNVPTGKNVEGIVLSPGMQSAYNKETGEVEIKRGIDTRLYTAWTRGNFMYENVRLEEMMREIGRWYDMDIVFGDQKARDLEFTGEFKRYNNFEQVLKFLQLTRKVDVKVDGNVIYIRSL